METQLQYTQPAHPNNHFSEFGQQKSFQLMLFLNAHVNFCWTCNTSVTISYRDYLSVTEKAHDLATHLAIFKLSTTS